jgi:uncharacterized protein (DUF427 family)
VHACLVATYEAVLGDSVIARSDATLLLEGNHYFPEADVRPQVLQPTDATSICPWKGRARYFAADVAGHRYEDVAWTYRRPLPPARRIKNRVAFARPVQIRRVT